MIIFKNASNPIADNCLTKANSSYIIFVVQYSSITKLTDVYLKPPPQIEHAYNFENTARARHGAFS